MVALQQQLCINLHAVRNWGGGGEQLLLNLAQHGCGNRSQCSLARKGEALNFKSWHFLLQCLTSLACALCLLACAR